MRGIIFIVHLDKLLSVHSTHSNTERYLKLSKSLVSYFFLLGYMPFDLSLSLSQAAEIFVYLSQRLRGKASLFVLDISCITIYYLISCKALRCNWYYIWKAYCAIPRWLITFVMLTTDLLLSALLWNTRKVKYGPKNTNKNSFHL